MLINMEKYGFAVETTDISSCHVQYSDANVQWGLQVRYNDYRRDPEYLYLSGDKEEVEKVFSELMKEISLRPNIKEVTSI